MEKIIIGMVHLKALPTAPNNKYNVEEIYKFALKDLKALEKGGIKYAIVENMFDVPYSNNPNLETIVAMSYIIGKLKDKTDVKLGVNIQSTTGEEEIIVATICGLDFIRSETFVDIRINSNGIMDTMCVDLTRKKKELNSNVKILADVNVKETLSFLDKSIDYSVNQAINAGADAIILTGLGTGKSPTIEDAKNIKKLCLDKPLFIGSGINFINIKSFMNYADGVIVGSSIKKEGLVENEVDYLEVKKLVSELNS